MNNPTDAFCDTNSYSLPDTCTSTELTQYKCRTSEDMKLFSEPFYSETIDCSSEFPTGCFNGGTEFRYSGTCNDGKCEQIIDICSNGCDPVIGCIIP